MPTNPPSELASIHLALAEVMRSVDHVAKRDRNESQSFNFRGIDAVVNAVGPALRQHGVIVVPDVRTYEYGSVEVGQRRTPMGHARVVVAYTFYGPAGDSIISSAPGEAFDSGDKATAKAMSVAFRTALLQALALPTDEPDADSQSYERSPVKTPEQVKAEEAAALIYEVGTLAKQLGCLSAVSEDWALAHEGQDIREATDLGGLELLRDELAAKAS